MTRFIIISKTKLKPELKFKLSKILTDVNTTFFGKKNDSVIEFFFEKRLINQMEIGVILDSKLITVSKYKKFIKIVSNKLSENDYKTDLVSFNLFNHISLIGK